MLNTKKVTLFNLIDLTLSVGSYVEFTVEFTKKDNTIREMECMKGVRYHLKNKGLKYSPDKFNLLPIFDIQKQAYRMINLSNLISLTLDKKNIRYEIE